MELIESLKRTFIKEPTKPVAKDLSTTSTPHDENFVTIGYDPFSYYTSQNYIGGATNIDVRIQKQQVYNQQIIKWREVATLPEVDEAIMEIASEAIAFDEFDKPIDLDLEEIELPGTIKNKIQDSFDKCLSFMKFKEQGDVKFRQWFTDGVLIHELIYDNKNLSKGVVDMKCLKPMNFQSIELNGKPYHFYNKDRYVETYKELDKSYSVFKDEQIVKIDSGFYSPDGQFYLSPIQKAMKPINQLYLIEDSIVIFRITRAPEKRVFNVFTGNLPKSKAEEYIKQLMLKYRQKRTYNFESGTIEDKGKSISILEDFWFSKDTDGRGTEVTTLQGSTQGMVDMTDVDYFVNKVYKALGVPVNRRDSVNSRMQVNGQIDIEKEEVKFYKYIIKLRRQFSNLFLDFMKKDLIARKVIKEAEWKEIKEKIKFIFNSTNAFADMRKMAVLNVKMDAANTASNLMQSGLVSKKWIQKNVLMLTDKELEDMAKEVEQDKQNALDDQINQQNAMAQPEEQMSVGAEQEAPQDSAPPTPDNMTKDDEVEWK